MELPAFLQLTEDQMLRETERQSRERRAFMSRRSLPEMSRAIAAEASIRRELESSPDSPELHNRLADCLATQGRFTSAAGHAKDETLREFCEKAAHAIFDNPVSCICIPEIAMVGSNLIRLPKFNVVKEVYSLKIGQNGYLVECSTCGQWTFTTQNPVAEVEKYTAETPNDLVRLAA